MNVMQASRRALARMFGRAGPAVPGSGFFTWPQNQTGIRVDEANALTNSAVFACVKVITEALSGLGWRVFAERDDGSKTPLPRHPADELLRRSPNPEQTPFVWREQMLGNVLLWGNAYSEIERDGSGRPIGLWPIVPERVRLVRVVEDGSLWYEVRPPAGFGAAPALVPAADMLHFRGIGHDGLMGVSVVRLAALSISLGIAAERFGASFFGNGAHVSGVLKHPGRPSEEARKNLRESWERAYQGVGRAMRTALLYEGMEWQQIGVPPEDAQFLQTREFQVTDVARWFGVKPHKIGDLKHATFSNIEEENISSVTDTLLPWANRFEQEANKKLLAQRRLFTKINLNALMRGNLQSRYTAYATARQWGWMSVNDVRGLEDMDPIGDEGDVYLSPLNMVDAGTVAGDATGDPAPPPALPGPASGPPAGAAAALRKAAGYAAARIVARERRKLESVAGAASLASVAEKMTGFVASHATWCASVLSEVADLRCALRLPTGVDPEVPAREHADRLAAWVVLAMRGDGIDPPAIAAYATQARAALVAAITLETENAEENEEVKTA